MGRYAACFGAGVITEIQKSWLPGFRRSGSADPAQTKLICFSPAGAGAGFWVPVQSALPDCDFVPVQLPGREERFGESLWENAESIGKAVADAIKAEGWDSVILVGYSYGSLLAFEVASNLERDGRSIHHLVACARRAPQRAAIASISDLSDESLIAYVNRLGGLPPELSDDPYIWEILLPVLRADFRANDNYMVSELRSPLACPISVIAGLSDAATAEGRAEAWGKYTSARFQIEYVDGGHFFIRENLKSFVGIFEKIVKSYAYSAAV